MKNFRRVVCLLLVFAMCIGFFPVGASAANVAETAPTATIVEPETEAESPGDEDSDVLPSEETTPTTPAEEPEESRPEETIPSETETEVKVEIPETTVPEDTTEPTSPTEPEIESETEPVTEPVVTEPVAETEPTQAETDANIPTEDAPIDLEAAWLDGMAYQKIFFTANAEARPVLRAANTKIYRDSTVFTVNTGRHDYTYVCNYHGGYRHYFNNTSSHIFYTDPNNAKNTSVFCAQPYRNGPATDGSSYSDTGSDNAWEMELSANQRNAISTLLAIYHEDVAGATGTSWKQYNLATQMLIWEFVSGNRNATYPYSLASGCTSCLTSAARNAYPTAATKYDAYIAKLKDNRAPSFVQASESKAKTYNLTYNSSTGKYEVTIPDANNIVDKYTFTSSTSGITTKVRNGALVITATPAAVAAMNGSTATLTGTGSRWQDYAGGGGVGVYYATSTYNGSYLQCMVSYGNIKKMPVYVKVKAPTASMQIQKQTADGKNLKGVQFEVVYLDSNSNQVPVGDRFYTTNSQGTITIKGLTPGKNYYIREVSNPYFTDTPTYTFGSTTTTTNGWFPVLVSGEYTSTAAVVTVLNYYYPVKMYKTSSTASLEGYAVQISRRATGSNTAKTWYAKSDALGRFYITDNKYNQLTEDKNYQFDGFSDGVYDLTELMSYVTRDSEILEATSMRIVVLDENGNVATGTNGRPLTDVTFTVDSATHPLTVSNGNYSASNIEITGLTRTNQLAIYINNEARELVIPERVTAHLELIKTDNAGARLSGATFLLTGIKKGGSGGNGSGSGSGINGGSMGARDEEFTWEVHEDREVAGLYVCDEGLEIGDEWTYTIQEITAPPGYKLDPNVYTLQLDIRNENGEDAYYLVCSNNAEGTFGNTPVLGHIILKKQDQHGSPVGGAVFRCQYLDNRTGSYVDLVTTDTPGAIGTTTTPLDDGCFTIPSDSFNRGEIELLALRVFDDDGVRIKYRIEEVSAPEGYIINEPLVFEGNIDIPCTPANLYYGISGITGNIGNWDIAKDDGYGNADIEDTPIIVNEYLESSITIMKTTSSGDPLAQATFLLEYSIDGETWYGVPNRNQIASQGGEDVSTTSPVQNGRLTTDASGQVYFADLPIYVNNQLVYYRVTEEAAPEGYLIATPIVFMGSLLDDDDNVYRPDIKVENASNIGALKLKKTNEANSPLRDAAFALFYSLDNGTTFDPISFRAGSAPVTPGTTTTALTRQEDFPDTNGVVVTGADGMISFEGLMGLYRLPTDPVTGTFTGNAILGTVSVRADSAADILSIKLDGVEVDRATCTFAVSEKSGYKTVTVTNSAFKRKTVEVTYIPNNAEAEYAPIIYRLQEAEAPAGYVLIQEPLFEGSIISEDRLFIGIDLAVENTELPGKINLVKYDEGTTPLAGAVYKLEWKENAEDEWHLIEPAPSMGDRPFVGICNEDVVDGCLTTDEDGRLSFSGLRIAKDGNYVWYRLTEVEAPDGYTVDPNPVFEGTLENGIEDVTYDGNNNIIGGLIYVDCEAHDTPASKMSVELNKYDYRTHQLLPDAAFQLYWYDNEANNFAIATLDVDGTGALGTFTVPGLVEGSDEWDHALSGHLYTDDDGHLKFNDLQTYQIVDGEKIAIQYKLVELYAPTGYAESEINTFLFDATVTHHQVVAEATKTGFIAYPQSILDRYTAAERANVKVFMIGLDNDEHLFRRAITGFETTATGVQITTDLSSIAPYLDEAMFYLQFDAEADDEEVTISSEFAAFNYGRDRGGIGIIKSDYDGQTLAGAKFKIEWEYESEWTSGSHNWRTGRLALDEDKGIGTFETLYETEEARIEALTGTVTTNEDGSALFVNMWRSGLGNAGKIVYRITEVEAPEGYQIAENPVVFEGPIEPLKCDMAGSTECGNMQSLYRMDDETNTLHMIDMRPATYDLHFDVHGYLTQVVRDPDTGALSYFSFDSSYINYEFDQNGGMNIVFTPTNSVQATRLAELKAAAPNADYVLTRNMGAVGNPYVILVVLNTPTPEPENDIGSIAVRKLNEHGEPMQGVKFLLEYSLNGTTWNPVTYTDTGDVVGGSTTEGIVNGVLSTGQDGQLTFAGLRVKNGDGFILYRLTEVETLPGYQLITEAIYEGTLVDGDAFDLTFQVINTPILELPDTGSNSLALTTLFGIMTMCTAAAYLVLINRKRKTF